MLEQNHYLRSRWHKIAHRGCTANFEEVQIILPTSDSCECCGKRLIDFSERHLDHDHDTGRLRGVLCSQCNVAQGLLKDIKTVISLARYLISKKIQSFSIKRHLRESFNVI